MFKVIKNSQEKNSVNRGHPEMVQALNFAHITIKTVL